jgi:hypothetical protein
MSEFNIMHETVGERIQVLSRPLMAPGQCSICGYAGTNVSDPSDIRVFIDWTLNIQYYGRVLICSGCLLEASNVLGWIGVKQAEELRNKVQEQESELIVLREQNDRLRDSLVSLLGGDNTHLVGIFNSSNQNERPREQEPQGTDTIPEGHESNFDESIGSEGQSSISANSGSNDFGDNGEFKL